MSERTASFHCTENRSDKVYFLSLVAQGDGFVVNTQYGPRGGSLTSGCKTPAPLTIEKAEKIFDKEFKARIGKGYKLIGGDVPVQVGDSSKADSGFRCQLLNAISLSEAVALNLDPDWYAQTKADGERRGLRIVAGNVQGINRKGEFVPVPAVIAEDVAALAQGAGETLIDGEIIGERFFAFDLVAINGAQIAAASYEERYTVLARLFEMGPAESTITLLPLARTSIDKKRLLANAQEEGLEGVVYKRRSAPYEAGRPASGGNQLKHKLYAEGSVRVSGATPGKRSVQMEAMEADGRWVDVGAVTVKPSQSIPAVGAIIDVKFLYRASAQGALFQPELLRERRDLDASACVTSQFRVKNTELLVA